MDAATLRSLRFRREREEAWTRLDNLLTRVERGSLQKLSKDDILAIPPLYRAALSSLSVARATSLDQALIEYLEALCSRAYFFVYGGRVTLLESVFAFFTRTWPAATRRIWRETLISALIMAVGGAGAFYLVMHDPAFFYSFVPVELAGGRDPTAAAETLRETLYAAPEQQSGLSVFATALFTHNARIALFAFALGVAFCVPSVALIAYNGATLGAMYYVFASQGLAFEFTAWLSVHGVTELFAIVLAGAAGMRVGWAVAFPGELTRLEAAERAGRESGVVIIGVVVMLLIAGLLEGFARQLVANDMYRYAIGGASGLLWALYFYLPRGRTA
jgi:uncharacterized membrane protein SpoIIM required for sporulation